MSAIGSGNKNTIRSNWSFIFSVIALFFIITIGYFFNQEDEADKKINDLVSSSIESINNRLANHKRLKTTLIGLMKLAYR